MFYKTLFIFIFGISIINAKESQIERSKIDVNKSNFDKNDNEGIKDLVTTEPTDAGTQQIVELKSLGDYLWINTSSRYRYTDNFFLVEGPLSEAMTVVWENSIDTGFKSGDFWIGGIPIQASASIGMTRVINGAGSNDNFEQFDYDSNRISTGITAFMGEYRFDFGVNMQRLVDFRNGYDTSFKNFDIVTSINRFHLLKEKFLFSSTWQLGYSFTHVDEVKLGNFLIQDNDRLNNLYSYLSFQYYHKIGSFILVPKITVGLNEYTENTNNNRTDYTLSLGINGYYNFFKYLNLNIYSQYNLKDSDNPSTHDYKEFSTGIEISASN